MKKLLIVALLFAGNSFAAEQRKFVVMCDKTDTIISTIREKYNEVPVFAGRAINSVGSTMSIWGNPATGTFTVLDSYEGMSCVIGVGTDLTLLLKEGEST